MILRPALFIIITFLITHSGYALSLSKGEVDSLNKVWANASGQYEQLERVQATIKLGEHYYFTQPSKADSVWTMGLRLAEQIKDKKGMAELLINTGYLLINKGDPDSSIVNFRKALEYRTLLSDKKGVASCLNMLGNAYYHKAQIKKTMEYFRKSLYIRKKIDDKKGIDECYNNIGAVLYQFAKYDSAIHYWLQCLELQEVDTDLIGMAKANSNIGLIYSQQRDREKAKVYFSKSIGLYIKIGDSVRAARTMVYLGRELYLNEQLDSAELILQKALKHNQRFGEKKNLAANLYSLGEVKLEKGDIDSARHFIQKSLELREMIGFKLGIVRSLETLSEICLLQGDVKNAVAHAERAYKYARSIGKNMESKLEHQKKEFARLIKRSAKVLANAYNADGQYAKARKTFEVYVEMYEKQQDIETAKRAALAQFEIDKAKDEAVREKEEAQMFYIGVGLVVVLILIAISFVIALRSRRKIKRQKLKTEEQKHIVENILIDIERSIQAAKRIQSSILPSQKLFSACFEDFFVYFRPKDNVSGDFFWLETIKDKVWFAVADCTGHGVPGAFMSVVGNNALKQAIASGLEKPGDILDYANDYVINTVHDKDNEMAITDGMDISLCLYDKASQMLYFSGANNPLYIIRDGKLQELKSDRQPIGYFVEEMRVPFTTHEFKLEKGDMIYLFTDGFPDQFGGPRNRKFKYKPFREMFTSIEKSEMSVQENTLDARFQEWKGENEQIDDVCIMGVRI